MSDFVFRNPENPAAWTPGAGWDVPVDAPTIPWRTEEARCWQQMVQEAARPLTAEARREFDHRHPIATARDRYGLKGAIPYHNNVNAPQRAAAAPRVVSTANPQQRVLSPQDPQL
jgi:hypothetical protein